MTSSALRSARSRPARASVGIGVVCIAVAAALSFMSPAVAQGWLIAFVIWSGVPIGSLVLLLIHRLVGGRWGRMLAPVLRPAAGLTPAVSVAFLPIAFGAAGIFPWVAHATAAATGVGMLYLNLPFFLARAAVALGGWSALAILVARGRDTPLVAGLGLAFFGLTISLVSVDWILSVDPRFASTAFPASIAIQQILSALAFAAVVSPERLDAQGRGDLGAFLIAAILGLVYLDLMSYVVSWYGDLPEKSEWYLLRSTQGWGWTIVTAAVVGALLPLGFLLNGNLRRDRFALRVLGVLILIGIGLHVAWLIGPAFAAGALIVAAIILALLTGISIPLANGLVGFLAQGAKS